MHPVPASTFLLLHRLIESRERSGEGQAASALPSSGMERDPCCFAGCLSVLSGLLALVNKARPWEADSQAQGLQLFIELLCTPAAPGEQTQPGKFLTLRLRLYCHGPRVHNQLFVWLARQSPGLEVWGPEHVCSTKFPFSSHSL